MKLGAWPKQKTVDRARPLVKGIVRLASRTWQVPSGSDPGLDHVVIVDTPYWACDCDAWKKGGLVCSHLLAVLIKLDEETQAVAAAAADLAAAYPVTLDEAVHKIKEALGA